MTLYEKLEKEFNEFCDSKDCEFDKCSYWWAISKDMCCSHFILTKLKEIDIDKEKEQIRTDTIAEISREVRFLYGNEYEKRIRAEVIEEYKHNLKETFNNEFPTNFHCTKPYFTLDNVRVLIDAVARETKEQK